MNNKSHHLITFAYISYLAMWTIFTIGHVFWFYFNHNLTVFHNGNISGLTDFVPIYIAGKIACSAQAKDLFNPTIYKQFSEMLTGCQFTSTSLQTPHFLSTYLFVTPFTNLPIETAHLVFDITTTFFGMTGIWLLIKQLGYAKKPITPLILLGILASNACWRNWTQGQIMWLFVGCASFYLYYFLKKQNTKAGIFLALSTIKPQYSIFLLVPSLACRRYSLLVYAFISELLLISICSIIFGIQTLLKYPAALHLYELTSDTVQALGMNCIRAFLSLVFSRSDAYQLSWLLNIICLIVLSIIAIYTLPKKEDMRTLRWTISSLILASLLFSPHAHLHDILLIALPAVLTIPDLDRAININTSPSLFFWKWILFLFPILSWLFFFFSLFDLWGNLFLTAIIAILFYCSINQIFKVTPDITT